MISVLDLKWNNGNKVALEDPNAPLSYKNAVFYISKKFELLSEDQIKQELLEHKNKGFVNERYDNMMEDIRLNYQVFNDGETIKQISNVLDKLLLVNGFIKEETGGRN